ncbi:DUF1772 domain-containing protein [Dyadobacter sp. CY261]|uniref:DUF1772 domain-containing protein n=1 Tax=Dyadobacter sp. CY261 TaxID=2907203 RepID=UPI001F27BEA3|nr:DUF1772 domain-containing protein [Dyadobacter sp. CY261]MCF0074214.1 DUF1772 domain-containing protein [Dyadobacter sp. CY261]
MIQLHAPASVSDKRLKTNRHLATFTIAAQSAFTGGCLVILLVLVPFWQTMSPAGFLSWFSMNAKALGSTMLPLEMMPLMSSIILSVNAFKKKLANKNAWMIAAICNLLVLVIFIAYFMPANFAMAGGTLAESKVASELLQWKSFHAIRTSLSILALFSGWFAMTRQSANGPANSDAGDRNRASLVS